MQLLESSPEEDNSCPQVPQGPSTSRAWRGPGRAGCVLPGKEKPWRGGAEAGEAWPGLFVHLFGYPCARPPRAWEGRRAGVLHPAGMAVPGAVPWARRGLSSRHRPGKPRALFPRAFRLSPGVGRLAWGWFGFGVFWFFFLVFLGYVCAF